MLKEEKLESQVFMMKEKDESPSRIKWIDIAKGICMISVILGHLGVNQINEVVFSYHLTVFFILSGYTMKIKPLNKQFVQSKFTAYMKPYFITCFFVMLGDILNNILLNHSAAIDTISKTIENDIIRSYFASGDITWFGSIQLPGRIGAIWFFLALFFGVMIVQVILYFINNDFARWFIVLSIALFGIISKQFIWFPFSIQAGMMASAFILFGFYLRKTEILEHIKWTGAIVCLIIFILGVKFHYSMLIFVSNNMKDYFVTPVVGITSSLLILWLSKQIKSCSILEYIGRNSMYYLCVHLFGLEVLGAWYYLYLLPHFSSYYIYAGVLFTIKIVLISISVISIIYINKKFNQKKDISILSTFDFENIQLDICKAILVITMLTGAFLNDSVLKKIILSCNIIIYVVISGYLDKERENKIQFKRNICELLLFYLVFAVGEVIIKVRSFDQLLYKVKQVALGMSNTKNLFQEIESIDIIYILLILICVKIIYHILTNVFMGIKLHFAVVLVSIIGYFLGQYGWWLPWSFDIALYAVVFYHIGRLIFEYKLLSIGENGILYFCFSSFLAYLVYLGGIDITNRVYQDYFIGVFGAVSGFFLLNYIATYLGNAAVFLWIKKAIGMCGQSLEYILVLFVLLGKNVLRYIYILFCINSIYTLISLVLFFAFFGIIVNVVTLWICKKINIGN